jgi:hypothetical protein
MAMNSSRFTSHVLRLLLLVALLIPTTAALAQGPVEPDRTGEYDLSWWTVDGGGHTGGSATHLYTLGGTAGQPDAAVWSGGDYVLAGGFWGGVAIEYCVFLPLVLRGA